jgi:hypothetical protein
MEGLPGAEGSTAVEGLKGELLLTVINILWIK